jgi:hypothetical protein
VVERELVVEAQALRLRTGEDAEHIAVRAAAWRDVVQPRASSLLAQT